MTTASIKSMGSGIGGAIILAIFCMTFLTLEKVVFIIPLFLAFTGAMTGFQLVDTLRGRIHGRFFFPFVMGAGQGGAVFAIVTVTGPLTGLWPMGYLGLTVSDLMIYIAVSGVTSYLGARLAARYFNL
ncbi:MAG: hypothetical protein MI892_15080 [Desulfobacterales bacterium]|nr:hypothetical protein [Desulfobacterales bacterium]